MHSPGRSSISLVLAMFLRYHLRRGGGLQCETEQTMMIFSDSFASMMNVLPLECDDWNVLLLLLLLRAGEAEGGKWLRPLNGRKEEKEGEKDGLSLERVLLMRILFGDTDDDDDQGGKEGDKGRQIRVRLVDSGRYCAAEWRMRSMKDGCHRIHIRTALTTLFDWQTLNDSQKEWEWGRKG